QRLVEPADHEGVVVDDADSDDHRRHLTAISVPAVDPSTLRSASMPSERRRIDARPSRPALIASPWRSLLSPRPSSWTVTVTASRLTDPAIWTQVASAWRTALVTASCATRKIASSTLAGGRAAGSGPPSVTSADTRTPSPVAWVARKSRAAPSPRSSRTGG